MGGAVAHAMNLAPSVAERGLYFEPRPGLQTASMATFNVVEVNDLNARVARLDVPCTAVDDGAIGKRRLNPIAPLPAKVKA